MKNDFILQFTKYDLVAIKSGSACLGDHIWIYSSNKRVTKTTHCSNATLPKNIAYPKGTYVVWFKAEGDKGTRNGFSFNICKYFLSSKMIAQPGPF